MPKVKTVHVSMRLPLDVVRAMKRLAKRDKVTMTEMVAPLLRATFAPDTVPGAKVMDELRKAAP